MIIAQINTPERQEQYLAACKGRPVLGALLPIDLELFGKSQPGRFYAGPGLAVELNGTRAWVAGQADPEELASFLHFVGCETVMIERTAHGPMSWDVSHARYIYGIAPGTALPEPCADKVLWASLILNREPSSGTVADWICRDQPARRDDFYSELCTKRSRGLASVRTLEQNGNVVGTVGAYAIYDGEAYLACGETDPTLRGRGVGGRMIVQLANELAAEGRRVTFLCEEERAHFYTRLGFKLLQTLTVYKAPTELNKAH